MRSTYRLWTLVPRNFCQGEAMLQRDVGLGADFPVYDLYGVFGLLYWPK